MVKDCKINTRATIKKKKSTSKQTGMNSILYKRVFKYITEDVMAKLHLKRGTPWFAYIKKEYFVFFSECPTPKSLTDAIVKNL